MDQHADDLNASGSTVLKTRRELVLETLARLYREAHETGCFLAFSFADGYAEELLREDRDRIDVITVVEWTYSSDQTRCEFLHEFLSDPTEHHTTSTSTKTTTSAWNGTNACRWSRETCIHRGTSSSAKCLEFRQPVW
jgi:hypothetical protein